MILDLPTLFAVTAFITMVAGCLLLFSWLQNRAIVALAFWGAGFLISAIGEGLLATRPHLRAIWSTEIANGIVLFAYGLMWSGARSFEGRRPHILASVAGVTVWVLACQVESFYASLLYRIVLTSMIIAGYTMLTVWEYLHARHKQLLSRWPAILLLSVHATFFVIRIPLAKVLPFPGGILPPAGTWFPIGMFGFLMHNFCMAFLVMNMAKERVELENREAALIDPLTGVPNRRAFLETGERMLRRMTAQGRSAALMVLDLDLFKQINDNFGHQAGDRVLRAFCDIATVGLRPSDLFGRLGGEEFACLLPEASLADAMQAAERIRAQFEGRPVDIGARRSPSTVSIGVATSADAGDNLSTLLAAADRALYQAKAKGRNRVEHVRPLPVPVPVPAHAVVG